MYQDLERLDLDGLFKYGGCLFKGRFIRSIQNCDTRLFKHLLKKIKASDQKAKAQMIKFGRQINAHKARESNKVQLDYDYYATAITNRYKE